MKVSRFDALEVRQYSDRAELGRGAAVLVADHLHRASEVSGAARVIFACAPSQDEFLAALIDQEITWPLVTVFHMDEYIGLSAEHLQSFRRYLGEHLLAHIDTPKAVHMIDGAAADLAAESARYAALLAAAPIDLVCMGIGENGHLAFNDPPVADFDDPQLVKMVELDEGCRRQQVHDGCFPTLEGVPRRALTLTIPALFRAAQISCVVPGPRKAPAVRQTLLGSIATSCPASILRTHPSAVLHIDTAAGNLL